MESAILDRNPQLADDFYFQLEQAKAHARRAAEVAAHNAEVIARYNAQAVDEPIQVSAVAVEAYVRKWGAK